MANEQEEFENNTKRESIIEQQSRSKGASTNPYLGLHQAFANNMPNIPNNRVVPSTRIVAKKLSIVGSRYVSFIFLITTFLI